MRKETNEHLSLRRAVCFTRRENVRLAVPTFPFFPRAVLLGGGIAAMGAAVALGFFNCPIAEYLHVPCPGCGMTRSVLALLQFDLAGVLRYNALGPIHLALSGWVIARSLWVIARDGGLSALEYRGEGRLMVLGFVVVQSGQFVLWCLRWFGLFGGPCPI
jgi:hypothetical protein